MRRILFAALSLLALSSVPGLAQNSGDSADRAFAQCGSISDAAQRLACYDAARGGPPAPAPGGAARYPEFGAPASRLQAVAPPPAQAVLPRNGKLVAGVVRYSFSPSKRFTIELDNGQVWQQNDSDDATAQFRKERNIVSISKGFWHSYDMRLNSLSAIFKVDRIK